MSIKSIIVNLKNIVRNILNNVIVSYSGGSVRLIKFLFLYLLALMHNIAYGNSNSWNVWRSSSLGVHSIKESIVSESGISFTRLEVNEINSSYVLLNESSFLDFSNQYHINTQVRVKVGDMDKKFIKVSLCVRASYPGFITAIRDREVVIQQLNTDSYNWQKISSDLNPYVENYGKRQLYQFANLDSNFFVAVSSGIGLCIYDSRPLLQPKRIQIDIGTLSITKTSIGYVFNRLDYANLYFNRQSSFIHDTAESISTIMSAIKKIDLSNFASFGIVVNNQAMATLSSHNKIMAEFHAIGASSLNENQYQQELINVQNLSYLKQLIQYKLNNPNNKLIHYIWDALGNTMLDDSLLSVPSNKINDSLVESMDLEQYKSASFILQNLSESKYRVLSIKAELKTSSGVYFPQSNIDVKVVKNWYKGSRSSILVNPYGLNNPVRVPELLLYDDDLIKVDETSKKNYLRVSINNKIQYIDISSPDVLMPNNAISDDSKTLQPFDIDAYRSKQVWLTLNSTGVLSGAYNGQIKVTYSVNNKIYEYDIPMTLNINSSKLHKNNLIYAIYYRGQIKRNYGFKAVEKSENQYVKEMLDLYKHGIRYPTQEIRGDDESNIRNYVKIRNSLGFPCDKYFFIGGIADASNTKLNFESNVLLLKTVISSETSCKQPDIYLYGKDEARGSDLDDQLPIWHRIHQAGGKVFVAGFTGTFAHVGNNLDAIVLSGEPNSEEINKFRNVGSYVFMYDNPQSGVPNPYLYKTNFGIVLLKNNYSGMMDYAYQDLFPSIYLDMGDRTNGLCRSSKDSYCSIWNNFYSDKYYGHVFAYPLSNSIVDTIQWEGMREAINQR